MNKLPQISEAEYEVMKVIWKYSPISTNEVTNILTKATDWNPKTIHTLLKRLVTKEAITYEKQSRLFVYTPLIDQNEYLQQQSHSFLKRFFNGNVSHMMTSFLDSENISDDDIKELKDILDSHSLKDVD